MQTKNSTHARRFAPLFLCAMILSAAQALAFGSFGHRTIAEIAQRGLNAGAKVQVEALLKVAPRPSLSALSTWPDELRDDPNATELAKTTARWHYMNFAKGRCDVAVASACPDGNCLVPQLQAQIEILGNRALPTAKRAEALGFVVHLFGDLHQPLHLGYAFDKGGNDFQINLAKQGTDLEIAAGQNRNAVDSARTGANLHALWDSLIFDEPGLGLGAEAGQIVALKLPVKLRREINVAAIARESCLIVQATDFYPARHLISRTYLNQMRPQAQLRVALAGARLAALLNKILSPK
jgi:nuclease S1